MLTTTTHRTSWRELDQRTGGGLQVRLLWSADSGQTAIEVEDQLCSGQRQLVLVPQAEAQNAFQHPMRYV